MRRSLLAPLVILSACATSSERSEHSHNRHFPSRHGEAEDESVDASGVHASPDDMNMAEPERPQRPDLISDHTDTRGTRYERENASLPPFEMISAWAMNDLTWCLETHSKDMPRYQQVRAIDRAAATWSRHDGITISRVAGCEDANIVVNFYEPRSTDAVGTDFEHVSDAPPLASAGFSDSWEQIEIQINDGFEWVYAFRATDAAVVRYDLQTTLLHELGHAIGLGHSEVGAAVMHPYYWSTKRQLSADDVDSVRSLYLDSNGPCRDSEAVAKLAYQAAEVSSEAAHDAREAYPQIVESVRAGETLLLAQERMWDGYSAASDSHLTDTDSAIEAVNLLGTAIGHLERGRSFAHRLWIMTRSEDALDAAEYATDAKWLAIGARRHAQACADRISE
jgi:hypothetical protein